MATSVQPVVYMAPSAPIAISVEAELAVMTMVGGFSGPVISVNGQVGAVLVLGPIVTTLAYASVITPDIAVAGHFRLVLEGDAEIADPAGAVIDGQRWTMEVHQDSVGGRTLTWGSEFQFGRTINNGNPPELSTSPGAYDYLGFIYNLSTGTHDCVGFVAGY